jgi:arylsulfatase A-like enzyme
LLPLLLALACTSDDPAPTDTEPIALEEALVFDGAPPTNVLMISIDTFRKDHLDPFGDLGITPFLSQLAEEGVLATNFQQCSNWTWHSTSCTLNGRYSEDTGHYPRLNGLKTKIPEGQRTLAAILGAEHDFGSVLVSSNSWLGPRWGNAQGYDVINPRGPNTSAEIIRRAVANVDLAMSMAGGNRWLAHAHLLEAHAPYVPPDDYRSALADLPPLPEGINLDSQDAQYAANDTLDALSDTDKANVIQHMKLRYQGEIAFIDTQVQEIFAELEADGMLDDTLVVVWTDHGEAFFEHGTQTHANHLYAEENNAIAFFWAKNLRAATVEQYTHAIDIVPTILHALDLPIDEDMPGYPFGLAPVDRIRFASTMARQGLQVAAFKGDYKLLYREYDESQSFYDLRHPEEQLDLLHEGIQPIAAELMGPLIERAARIRPLLDERPPINTK